MLNTLVRYYEILAEDANSMIPKQGYGIAKISFSLNIDDNGDLINITSCKIHDGKKLVPKPMMVPQPVTGRSGTKAQPDFLFGNSSYVLGFDSKDNKEMTRKCFNAFKEFNIQILRNAPCKEAESVIKFLEKWNPDNASANPLFAEYLDEIYKGAVFIFRYHGIKDVHNIPVVRKAWEIYKKIQRNSFENTVQQCLVTGEKTSITVLHDSIKGLYNGQPMGNKLVSFNANAYESYNPSKKLKQGLNAPVGEYAAFAYATALNKLLSDNSHKIILGDTTVVFWAETAAPIYQDIFSIFMDCSEIFTEQQNKKYVRSEQAEMIVKKILDSISKGNSVDADNFYKNVLDNNIRFYVLGLSPNAARISVRFFLQGNFGSFINRITSHYEDLSIQRQFESDLPSIPVWKILNETLPQKSEDKSISTYLSTSLMRSIIMGDDYPASLYQTILLRIRGEQNVNYYKASILKACLLRKERKMKNKMYKEVLTLALNEESKNKAYLLGRLFAVLEKAQKDANPEVKSTIRDRYFSSASTTPATTFPILLSLVQHHISKSDYGASIERKITEIMDKLDVDPFPKVLSLDEQGLFYLGFYHQRNSFYKK
ncbi:MAG: type I-C CRISPR-associated protein Cas8c/Csd1 [Clostridiaceae bacterium]|nr:type I-C CRISPR-associated protein Cas8c/Csd1 [Clostridiaceae bacterium]